MFKKTFFIVLFLAVFAFIAVCANVMPVAAQSRFGLKSSGPIEADADLKLPAGTWVYGARIYADAASSYMGLYNNVTVAGGQSTANNGTQWMDEIGEATQYDTAEILYPSPIYFSNGVSVGITTGVGWVNYGPEPD